MIYCTMDLRYLEIASELLYVRCIEGYTRLTQAKSRGLY
jgi:hypothetical protein